VPGFRLASCPARAIRGIRENPWLIFLRRFRACVPARPAVASAAMNVMKKLWDFTVGAVLFAGAPMIIFLILTWLYGVLLIDTRVSTLVRVVLTPIWWVADIGIEVITWRIIIRWRKKHRYLPPSFLVSEISVGILLGSVFLIILLMSELVNGLN
jgi:hypothetical protein